MFNKNGFFLKLMQKLKIAGKIRNYLLLTSIEHKFFLFYQAKPAALMKPEFQLKNYSRILMLSGFSS